MNNYLVYGTAVYSNNQTAFLLNDGIETELSTNVIGGNYSPAAPSGSSTILVYINSGTDLAPVWSSQTVGLDGTDNSADFDVMWDSVNQILTFVTAPPNLKKAVKIIYRFLYQGGQPYSVPGSISKYGRTLTTRVTASDSYRQTQCSLYQQYAIQSIMRSKK